MAENIQLNAQMRTAIGKGANRRLRRLEQRVPGVVYGGGGDNIAVSLSSRELEKAAENELFYSQILTLDIGGKGEQAILRELQRHPATDRVTHIDFQRVRADEEINVNLSLHFLNEDRCVGVRLGGGVLSHNLTEVEISCLPRDLPQFIEVDVGEMKVGDSLHLTDLKLPPGVTIVALTHGEEYDQPVVSVNEARVHEEEEKGEADAPEAAKDDSKAADKD